jgi:hypothetical protein
VNNTFVVPVPRYFQWLFQTLPCGVPGMSVVANLLTHFEG